MRKITALLAALVMALSCVAILGGCGEVGNEVVNKGKEYLKSEAGVSGDVSSLKSQAIEYGKNELGLNGDNDVIEGTWKQTDKTNGDWVWTFDGKGSCHLQGITVGFESDGSYTSLSFDTLSIEEATIELLSPDAASGATPIRFVVGE